MSIAGNHDRPRILVFTPYFLPGQKGGGTTVALSRITHSFSDQFDFRVITTDRDVGDSAPYPDIQPGIGHSIAGAQVFYLPRSLKSTREIRLNLEDGALSLIYLNSFFHHLFGILPILLARIKPSGIPILVAPRGELSSAALEIRAGRKFAYLRFAKILNLYDNVVWSASSEHEAEDIRRHFPDGDIRLVPEFVPRLSAAGPEVRKRKEKGKLRLVFLARIAPIKNLDGALDLLEALPGEISLDIHGPVADQSYWKSCERRIGELPGNVTVRFHGPTPIDSVTRVLAGYDMLLLPTKSENFGHVILESLSAGTPVLISDQTPWRKLEAAGVGWDVPLSDKARFRSILGECVEMSASVFERMSGSAEKYAESTLQSPVRSALGNLLRELSRRKRGMV